MQIEGMIRPELEGGHDDGGSGGDGDDNGENASERSYDDIQWFCQ